MTTYPHSLSPAFGLCRCWWQRVARIVFRCATLARIPQVVGELQATTRTNIQTGPLNGGGPLEQRIHVRAEEEFDLTVDQLLQQHVPIAFVDAGDFWDWDENSVRVKPLNEMTPEQRSVVRSTSTGTSFAWRKPERRELGRQTTPTAESIFFIEQTKSFEFLFKIVIDVVEKL